MTAVGEVIVLVGPNVIRGPIVVDEENVEIAIRCIDDRLALVGDRVVNVGRLWHELMSSVAGTAAKVVVVLPSWWAPQRCSLVVGAMSEAYADVVVLHRADVLRSDDACVVVEIADELVAVHAGERPPVAIPRTCANTDTSAAVADRISGSSAVVIDAPSGVVEARDLGQEITRRLRARGTTVSVADDDTVLRTVRAARQRRRGRWHRTRFVQPRAAVVATSVLSVTALAWAAVGSGAEGPVVAESAWVVEGRVSVEVPAHWKVERVTTGPGSARLQVVSSSDPQDIINVTQSAVPTWQSLTSAAEVLRNLLAAQPAGVFVEFNGANRRADRAAITYREVRRDRVVDWTVLLDGGVRIAIGCQSAPDRRWPEWICDRAIRSARVLA